jgi:hypothetical protein
MPKVLPSQAGRKQWTYTCHTMYYTWSTVVVANSVKDARAFGLREARAVMGNHARIHKDEVTPLA